MPSHKHEYSRSVLHTYLTFHSTHWPENNVRRLDIHVFQLKLMVRAQKNWKSKNCESYISILVLPANKHSQSRPHPLKLGSQAFFYFLGLRPFFLDENHWYLSPHIIVIYFLVIVICILLDLSEITFTFIDRKIHTTGICSWYFDVVDVVRC